MPTKQQVEGLIERIGGVKEIFACRPTMKTRVGKAFKTVNTVYLGTVLEKIQDRYEFLPNYRYEEQGELVELVLLWQPLGLSRSLQEIVAESGYRTIFIDDGEPTQQEVQILKSPEASALLAFILHLFPEHI